MSMNKSLYAVSLTACLAFLAACVSCEPSSSGGGDDGGNFVPSRPGFTVNHLNYDPGTLTNAQISAAAALDSYFQHASVGDNVVSGISTLAGETDSRYVTAMSSVNDVGEGELDWFDTNDGLMDHQRSNPGATQKIAIFTAAFDDDSLASKIDVASFKFCWIDDPEYDNAEFTTGQDLFNATKAAMNTVAAAYPEVDFVWWTMPIHQTEESAERQAFNDLVRAHCAENRLWLFDIAAIESHHDDGSANATGSGIEMLCDEYTDDGGHPNGVGERKLGLAWWRLMAGIAAARQ